MNPPPSAAPARRPLLVGVALLGAVVLTVATAPGASAATPDVGLGTAAPFAVLAGAQVTNTGASVIDGDLGVAPGLAATGFPPATLHGAQHLGDAVALQAKSDLVTAYDDAAGRASDVDQTGVDLGGSRLVPGVYTSTSGLSLTGTVTLDAQGDPDAVFVLRAASTLVTGSGSTVSLVGSAQPCHVYWQVGSSATLGTSTRFVGTILALTSASLLNGASLEGRVLARNGEVTLDNNRITRPGCATRSAVPTPTATPTASTPTATATTAGTTGSGSKGGKGGKDGKDGKGSEGGKAGSSGGSGSGGSTTGPSGGSSGGGSSTTGGSPGSPGAPGGPGTPGTPGGPGSPVPSGHPETGAAPTTYAASAGTGWPDGPPVLLVGAVLLGAAAVTAGGSRRRATHRAR